MNKEVKDILGLLVIVLPACIFIFAWWLSSPMYAAVQQQQRLDAQLYLTGTYYYNAVEPYTRQALIDRHGFTDADINPHKLMENCGAYNETTKNYQPKLTIDGYFRGLFRGLGDERTN